MHFRVPGLSNLWLRIPRGVQSGKLGQLLEQTATAMRGGSPEVGMMSLKHGVIPGFQSLDRRTLRLEGVFDTEILPFWAVGSMYLRYLPEWPHRYDTGFDEPFPGANTFRASNGCDPARSKPSFPGGLSRAERGELRPAEWHARVRKHGTGFWQRSRRHQQDSHPHRDQLRRPERTHQ